MAEVTHGIDDKRTYSIQTLAKNADSLSSVINLTNEYTSGDYSYAGGYMLLRYLAKQGALQSLEDEPNPLLISLTAGDDNYTNTLAGATIFALGGNDIITNNAFNVTIDAGAGNDTIINSGANVVFNYASGDGNDSIVGFNSTTTLNIARLLK